MILQRLHSEYGLKIELVLIKEYKRLGLTMQELNVLLVLLDNYPRKRTFSLLSITRKTDYNQNEVADIFNQLLEKEFVTLELDQKSNRTRELYFLDKTFIKLTKLLIEDQKEQMIAESKSKIADTIMLLEKKFNSPLKPNDLDRVRLWYENQEHTHEQIINTINASKKGASIFQIEKLLSANISKPEPLDSETSKILDKIFKGL